MVQFLAFTVCQFPCYQSPFKNNFLILVQRVIFCSVIIQIVTGVKVVVEIFFWGFWNIVARSKTKGNILRTERKYFAPQKHNYLILVLVATVFFVLLLMILFCPLWFQISKSNKKLEAAWVYFWYSYTRVAGLFSRHWPSSASAVYQWKRHASGQGLH